MRIISDAVSFHLYGFGFESISPKRKTGNDGRLRSPLSAGKEAESSDQSGHDFYLHQSLIGHSCCCSKDRAFEIQYNRIDNHLSRAFLPLRHADSHKMNPQTAQPRPVGSLSPLQVFAQTARPSGTQTNLLAQALTGSNGRPSATTNASEQNAWERNLLATASLGEKIGGKCPRRYLQDIF